jgi:hypothetical protein
MLKHTSLLIFVLLINIVKQFFELHNTVVTILDTI